MPKGRTLSFNLANTLSMEIEIEFISEIDEKEAFSLVERIESLRLSKFKELEVRVNYKFLKSISALQKMLPLVRLTKHNLIVEIYENGLSVRIIPPTSDGSTFQKIKRKHLDEATDLLNRLLLEILGINQSTMIHVESTVDFQITKRVDDLNHLLELSRLETSSKLGLVTTIEGLVFKIKEIDSDETFEIHMTPLTEQPSDSNSYFRWSITCISNTKLKSFDFETILAKSSNISKKAAAIMGV